MVKASPHFDFTKVASGTVSRQQLRDLCLSFNPKHAIKQADIGGEQESGFEQAFSSLAYAYLKDKAPRLLDYIVGFQLVDRNEDNTKAVAIFGFKVGKQWLYAPVFFLNGDLKGHELLYIKNQDAFVPMKENWVNYIMSRKPHILGEGSPKDVFQLGGLSPNIERMSWPPNHSKYGSDHLGLAVESWAKDFLLPIASCAEKQARFIWRDRAAGETFSIEKLAAAPLTAAFLGNTPFDKFLADVDWRMTKAAWEISRRFPGIKLAIDKFYGDDFFERMALHHKQAADAGRLNIMPPKPVVKQAAAVKLPGIQIMTEPPTVKRAAGDEKVKIVTRDDVAIKQNLPDLTDDDKAKVLSHGYLVKDERTGDEVTKVYNTQVRQVLTNPHETGIYEVLEAPGSFARMLVITKPVTNAGGQDFVTVVRLGDGDKAWVNIHRNRVFAQKIEMDEDYRKWFEKLPEEKTLEKDGVYIAVNQRGEGTTPFRVREHYDKGEYESYKVNFEDYSNYKGGRPSWSPLTQNSPGNPYNRANDPDGNYISSYGATLVLNGRKGTKLSSVGGELHVPTDSFRFFKVKSPPKPKKNESGIMDAECCGECGSDPLPIMPGDIKDIQMLFTQKTASLKLLGDAHEVSIYSQKTASHDRMGYGQALFHLIRVHGTSEDTAKEMLKSAQVAARIHTPVVYRVKYADSYPLPGPGPSSPPIPAPQYGTEQMGYNSVNAIYPQEENIPIPGMDSNRTDPRIYDPFLRITPDQQALSFAQEAGQTGQKEVFDTAAIASMLKSVRQDTIVDKYLGDLMKALDRCGRILFCFYWHSEEFEDRYGRADLPELEDSLRNTFESIGDLTLFLKEKSVDPGIDDTMDPSIEESAKN